MKGFVATWQVAECFLPGGTVQFTACHPRSTLGLANNRSFPGSECINSTETRQEYHSQ